MRSLIAFLICMILLLAVIECVAQEPGDYEKSIDIGITGGTHFFFGDVEGRPGPGAPFLKDWNRTNLRPALGIELGYHITDIFSVRLLLGTGEVNADDRDLGPGDNSGRFQRGLRFRSQIREAALMGQYIFRQRGEGAYNEELRRLAPTVGVGIGYFGFDPETDLEGRWYRLQPLSTEGQGFPEYPDRKPYRLGGFYIPLMAGLHWSPSVNWHFRLACTWRKTFTDYIDDVSNSYVDPALFSRYLPASLATVARTLQDRSGQYNNGISLYPPGSPRGKDKNDTWVSVTLGLIFNFTLQR